jgi:hypothetical protein
MAPPPRAEDLRRQALATLLPTTLDDQAPTTRAHTLAKAVVLLALEKIGLECTLHDLILCTRDDKHPRRITAGVAGRSGRVCIDESLKGETLAKSGVSVKRKKSTGLSTGGGKPNRPKRNDFVCFCEQLAFAVEAPSARLIRSIPLRSSGSEQHFPNSFTVSFPGSLGLNTVDNFIIASPAELLIAMSTKSYPIIHICG